MAASIGGYFYMGQMGYWPARKRMVAMYGGQLGPWEEYQFEPKATVHQSCGPNDQPSDYVGEEGPFYSPGYNLMVNSYVKLADRRVFFQTHRIWAVGADGPAIPEGPDFGWVFGALCLGRSEIEVCIAGSQGIRFYNTVTQEVSRIYQIGINSSTIFYVPEHEVLVSITSTTVDEEYGGESCLYIWSLETEPTSLSEVEVYDGEVKSGQVVTYRVRALGTPTVIFDPEDPAEGELIDWTITGVGTLLQTQTTTDADGWAYVQVQYLVDDVGSSTVTASLIC
jgi:hypothetical protein